MEATSEIRAKELVSWALACLQEGRIDELRDALAEMHPAEIADLLESMPPEQRSALWEVVPAEQESELLPHMHDEARASIISEMGDEELVAAAERMDVEDLAEVIEELPRDLSDTILDALEQDHRTRLEAVLAYDEDTAGRLMSTDVLSVRPSASIALVLRWLRRHASLPPHTDALMVINTDGTYLGKLSMEAILTEARQLEEIGIRELILIAQDTTDFGHDRGIKDGLAQLLESLVASAPGIDWIRVMYAYPGYVTDRLIEVMAPQRCCADGVKFCISRTH